MIAGDVAVIPSNVEHEGFFPAETEVIDIFAPPREFPRWRRAALYAHSDVTARCRCEVAKSHLTSANKWTPLA
jgi:hypothetical protein